MYKNELGSFGRYCCGVRNFATILKKNLTWLSFFFKSFFWKFPHNFINIISSADGLPIIERFATIEGATLLDLYTSLFTLTEPSFRVLI